MRMFLGVLSMAIVIVIIFVAQSGRLGAVAQIPELAPLLGSQKGQGEFSLANAHPQKILESFKKTMSAVSQRNEALLRDELPSNSPAPETEPSSQSSLASAIPPEVETSKTPEPQTPQVISKYGMSLVQLQEPEAQPYLGQWFFKNEKTQIHMSLKPHRNISSVRIVAAPRTDISFAHSQLPLWRNTQTGQIILLLGDDEYIQLTGEAPVLKGFLYQRHREAGTSSKRVYRRSIEFSLHQ